MGNKNEQKQPNYNIKETYEFVPNLTEEQKMFVNIHNYMNIPFKAVKKEHDYKK